MCAVHGPVGSQVLRECTTCCSPASASAAPLPLPNFGAVAAFARKIAAVQLGGPIAKKLYSDFVALGAIYVRELTLSDWRRLRSWKKLLPLQARRLSIKGLGEQQQLGMVRNPRTWD